MLGRSALLAATNSGGPPDPYFSSVSLLLHMDGANGSTTFVDSSSNAFSITANNGASIFTALSRFGSGSFRRSTKNHTEYLTTPIDQKFQLGTGNFTVEMWIYKTSDQQDQGIFTFGGTASGLKAVIDESTVGISVTGQDPNVIIGGNVVRNTWYHLAICQNSGQLRAFLQGQQIGVIYSNNVNLLDNQLKIGYSYSNEFGMAGYIDEFRVTKGVARYTANFTPPTEPFPDF